MTWRAMYAWSYLMAFYSTAMSDEDNYSYHDEFK